MPNARRFPSRPEQIVLAALCSAPHYGLRSPIGSSHGGDSSLAAFALVACVFGTGPSGILSPVISLALGLVTGSAEGAPLDDLEIRPKLYSEIRPHRRLGENDEWEDILALHPAHK
jgi:hypothetical protein